MTAGDEKDPIPPLTKRGAALILDALLLAPLAFQASRSIGPEPWILPLMAFAYFAAFPLTPWQGTPGKRVVGIRLCGLDGGPVSARAAVLRAGATVGWCYVPSLLVAAATTDGLGTGNLAIAIQLLLFVPWLAALFSPRRRTLFDRLAATYVAFRLGSGIKVEQKPESGRRGSRIVVAVLALLGFGFVMVVFLPVYEDRNLRGRVAYAMAETTSAREKMIEFHDREKRWPAPPEIGVKDWNPYPAGGGYRVHADGTVVISFSEKPQLKGHSITLRAQPQGEGAGWNRWKCEADPGFAQQLLPASCRRY